MGDSNVHGHKRLPLFLAGHACGHVSGNQHVATPDGTPMANAWLAVLKKLGVNADRFGDSDGVLEI